jgi:hypothetical protein
LEVKRDRASDKAYFKAINDELNSGGKEAFLHMMLSREITSNLSRAPVTEALEDQRVRSAPGESATIGWWRQCMQQGHIPLRYPLDEDATSSWPMYDRKPDLYVLYREACRNELNQHPEPDVVFFKDLYSFGCKSKQMRVGGGQRIRAVEIPPLTRAAQLFTEFTNIPVDLEIDDEE